MRNLVLSALILASAFQTALGQTYTSGDYQYTLSNGQATITGYTGAGGAVSIPSALFSSMPNPVPYIVVSIGSSAFSNSPNLTSVSIPNSVTSIGSDAFCNCLLLTSVSIPYSVTSIGSAAFFNCPRLASVSIPGSVTSIGPSGFANCPNLTSVSIPNSVTSIGSDAFSGCVSLGFVSIPSSVTSIGGGAFSGSGLGSVLLPPNPGQIISQAGFPSTAVFYYGSLSPQVGPQPEPVPSSMASQADLAATQAQLATTQADLVTTKAELATTKSQITTAINEGKASGIASVTASPNTWSLFTTSQIQNMAVGDLVLTRTNGSNLVLNYDIEQSEDLQTWTTYQAYSLPLTNLPTNKAFVRIKAKQ